MTTAADDTAELLVVARGMTAAIRDLSGDVKSVATYGQHNRRLIWVVAVSVTFDICLSLALGAVAVQSRHASDKATKASSTLVVNCLSGNESRKIQTDLWNTVLAFPPPPVETAEARTQREAQTAKFRTYIGQAFAQRDCSKP